MKAGIYYVQVTDAANLYGYANVFIGTIAADSARAVSDTCSQGKGILSVYISGGTAPYMYSWSNGAIHTGVSVTTDSIHAPAGSYGLVITDASGCFLSALASDSSTNANLYIPDYSPVTTTVTTTPDNCKDGTATVTAANGTLPYSYYWNTVPPRFTATIDSLEAFTYFNILVTDAAGCTDQNYAYLSAGPNHIQTSATVNGASCPNANGSFSLAASGGTPPYSYLWNTGATTSTISGLAPGNYTCRVTDAAGCTSTVRKNVPQVGSLNVQVTTTAGTCGNNDGIAVANVLSGTPPYAYLWSTGDTTSYDSSLSAGNYYLVVVDANQCEGYRYVYINQPISCYAHLTGTVWNDLNGNCFQDGNEYGLPFPNISISPFSSIQPLNSYGTGYYSIDVMPGSYTVTNTVPASWSPVCPVSSAFSYTTTAGTTYSDVFYIHPDSLFDDLSCNLYCDQARPGFTEYVWIHYRNNGTTVMNGTVDFEHDALTVFNSSTVTPSSYNAATHTATFAFSNLLPRESISIRINLGVPPGTPDR
jgi:hypothetical protein